MMQNAVGHVTSGNQRAVVMVTVYDHEVKLLFLR